VDVWISHNNNPQLLLHSIETFFSSFFVLNLIVLDSSLSPKLRSVSPLTEDIKKYDGERGRVCRFFEAPDEDEDDRDIGRAGPSIVSFFAFILTPGRDF